jgi:Zinc knuckle
LVKSHEGKSKLDKMLSVQQSPNDKSGLGFISNNKKKSKINNKKKGQEQVKDPAKIVCFKCKIEGHHVRSCPLKKKPLSGKQKGKSPQIQAHAQPQVEERPLFKKNHAKAPIVEKSSEKKGKRRTCYICREKGHLSSSCTNGTSSNPIIIDDVYSLRKDEGGNVFAKYVGTQSGVKKRTIWVAKPIVTNFLGPNLVGDQQAQT